MWCKQSLKDKTLKALNDLIIASLLTKYKIIKSNNRKYLEVRIHPEKVYLLQDFIRDYDLDTFVEIQSDEKCFIIHPSFMLEQKLKDWTKDGQVVAMNPADLNINTLLFWATLFAYQNQYSVIVDTDLTKPLQETFSYLFTANIKNCKIVSNGSTFYFQSFLELYLLSDQRNRPYAETAELYAMLSEKELRRLKKIIAQEKGEVVF